MSTTDANRGSRRDGPTIRGHSPHDPRLSCLTIAMTAVANPDVLCDIFFLRRDRSVLCRENHECTLIDMPCLEKVEQAAHLLADKGHLDKIVQVVADPTNVKLLVVGVAEFEPAAAGPEVNCLVVSLCALIFIPP